MAEKNKHKKRSLVRSFARAHGVFTILLFMFYVAFAMLGNFSMLAKDIKDKYVWASTTLSVYVNALPDQPIITANSGCSGEQAIINLSWNATASTDYYDILRDGQILVNGVTERNYTDSVVSVGVSYTYIVIAHGSLGSVSSPPKTVFVDGCSPEPPLPDPQCKITSLDGEPIDSSVLITTENRSPKISGTTNIKNAIILINIFPGPIISSTINAQANGFWEYSVYGALPLGSYTFQVTAIDPNDSNRRITTSVQIKIIEKDDDDDDNDDGCGSGKRIIICHNPGAASQKTMIVSHPEVKGHLGHGDYCGACKEDVVDDKLDVLVPQEPLDEDNEDIPIDILSNPEKNLPLVMNIEILNNNKIVYSNQNIFIRVLFNWKNMDPQNSDLTYEIINENGQVISSISKNNRASIETLEQIIPLPRGIEYGKYILRVRTKINGMHVISQDNFMYNEAPMVNLGGSIMFTYSELVSSIGWFAIICLLLMLIILIIWSHEYYLYSRSLRAITENGLREDGLISKRKGVSL